MDLESGEAKALLGLMLTAGLGPTLVGRCVEAFGSAENTLGVSAVELGGIKGIAANKSGELRRRIEATLREGVVQRELEAVAKAKVRLVHRDDWGTRNKAGVGDEGDGGGEGGEGGYPALLRHIPDPPLLLWVRGELRREDGLALGIVGSRKCSHYGREQADRFAAQCGSAGLTIVSGGAYGIDIAAHRAALRVKCRTTAVIGSGLGAAYPQDHVPVFREIVGEGLGAVVSELPMLTGPKPENFPRRNRIISGMSLGVLVVEAAKRSGALITARLCVEEHGRECMALPGRVDSPASAGCHQIIRDGWAMLVTSATDVLDQLGEAGRMLKEEWEAAEDGSGGEGKVREPGGEGSNGGEGGAGAVSAVDANLSETQRQIVAVLGEKGADGGALDQIVAETGLAVGAVSADLTMLEIRGVVQRRGGLFVRRR